jgi:7-carboxy-7-deazaguanine synthase
MKAGAALKYPLAPQGVFWTLQGEGALAGEPMAFVRLAGCSVGCAECDTDYRVTRWVVLEELVCEIQAAVPEGFTWPWVWITGGEPTDHDIAPLVDALRTVGFRVALATAGTKPTPGVDWLSVSPHSVDVVQRHGHEIKVVPGLNGLTWEALAEIKHWSFPWRFIQPLWGADVTPYIEFVKTNPGWRLASQAHKGWQIP